MEHLYSLLTTATTLRIRGDLKVSMRALLTLHTASTTLRNEQHWKLDLEVPADNAIAHKLLERVYEAAIKEIQELEQHELRAHRRMESANAQIEMTEEAAEVTAEESMADESGNVSPLQAKTLGKRLLRASITTKFPTSHHHSVQDVIRSSSQETLGQCIFQWESFQVA